MERVSCVKSCKSHVLRKPFTCGEGWGGTSGVQSVATVLAVGRFLRLVRRSAGPGRERKEALSPLYGGECGVGDLVACESRLETSARHQPVRSAVITSLLQHSPMAAAAPRDRAQKAQSPPAHHITRTGRHRTATTQRDNIYNWNHRVCP
ncbi:uncharacterized protein LOC144230067 [Crocuta crocuta]